MTQEEIQKLYEERTEELILNYQKELQNLSDEVAALQEKIRKSDDSDKIKDLLTSLS